MKKSNFDEPLTKAAADSLRRAANVARERAARTTGFVVMWKNGRVARIPVMKSKKRGAPSAGLAASAAK
ncbi:MAG: hypothetical protein Q8N18_22440 [Opitutaceae bacterium]|nr:hypothetical protein [Opitutaceae bacterium]